MCDESKKWSRARVVENEKEKEKEKEGLGVREYGSTGA